MNEFPTGLSIMIAVIVFGAMITASVITLAIILG